MPAKPSSPMAEGGGSAGARALFPSNTNRSRSVAARGGDEESTQIESSGGLTKRIEKLVKIPFVNLDYGEGFVSFEYRLYNHLDKVVVRVENEFIKSQFDSVSKYISKQIGRKNAEFNLVLEVHFSRTNIVESFSVVNVVSEDISKIDENIIDRVKYDNAFDLIFKRSRHTDENAKLHTSDEFYSDYLDNELKPTTDEPADILNKAFEYKRSKHYLQLKYLADKHKANNFKLRFTTKPFSFLFLLEGVVSDYFVLETYDNDLATYVWRINKNISAMKEKFGEIEKLLVAFEETNRLNYISSRPEGFTRIIHDYVNEVDGFNKWKVRLDEVII